MYARALLVSIPPVEKLLTKFYAERIVAFSSTIWSYENLESSKIEREFFERFKSLELTSHVVLHTIIPQRASILREGVVSTKRVEDCGDSLLASFRAKDRAAVGLAATPCYTPPMLALKSFQVMAKPPPEVRAQIAALSRNDPSRGGHLLHDTLI